MFAKSPLLRAAVEGSATTAAAAAASSRVLHPVDSLFKAAATLQRRAPEVPAQKELADLAVSAERALESDPRRFVDISHCVAGIVPHSMLADYRKAFSSSVVNPFLKSEDSSLIGLADEQALAVFLVAADLGILRGSDNVEVTAALSKRLEKVLPTADFQLLLSSLGPVKRVDAALARQIAQELLSRASVLDSLQLASLAISLSSESEETRHKLLAEIDLRLQTGDGLSERDLVDLVIASLRLDPSKPDERRAAAAKHLIGFLSRHIEEDHDDELTLDKLQWAADAATLLGVCGDAALAEMLAGSGRRVITADCVMSPMLVDLAVSVSRGLAVSAPSGSPAFTAWMQHLCSTVIIPEVDLRLILRLGHGLQELKQEHLQWGLTWDFIAQTLLGRQVNNGQISEVISLLAFASDRVCTEVPQDGLQALAARITSPGFINTTNVHSLALIALNCVKVLQDPERFLIELAPAFKNQFLRAGIPPATVCLALSAYGRAVGKARLGTEGASPPPSFRELHDAAAVALLQTKIPFTQQQCHIILVTRPLMNDMEESSPAFTALVGKILLSAVSTNPPSRDSETTIRLLKGLRAGPEVEKVLVDSGLIAAHQEREGPPSPEGKGRDGAEARMKAAFKKAVAAGSATRGSIDLSNVQLPDPNETWWQTARRRWSWFFGS
ncbi:hypothetical protein FOZ63_009733 [Perkinsus olseni]|uniref:Uncharacterized protein n=2 Tax=Perkinsus olseni TaxID=32597 RepID=A0A7J6PRR5_PEROL|nr:hypothetical protein FOZ63_009733 [Perkinsus olseni]